VIDVVAQYAKDCAMHASQTVPVKVFRSLDMLTVAAPMAGLGPEDITVDVTPEGLLILHGTLCTMPKVDCGELKGNKEVLVDEWAVGPYHREVPLRIPVDGEAARLTYGNGVVVVALPISERMRPAHITATA
jgi:HSP20 family protein